VGDRPFSVAVENLMRGYYKIPHSCLTIPKRLRSIVIGKNDSKQKNLKMRVIDNLNT
jgi:hypothetical protein